MTTEWWCRGDLTAILEAARDRQEIPLSRPYVLIGSGEAADVRLTAPGIPRRLLYVHASHAGLFAVPLVEPSQFQPLPQGRLLDRVPLQLGPYRITFHWQPETEPQTGHDEERGEGDRELREGDLCRRGSLGGPGWEVEVRCDGQTLALIHIRRRLTLIGRRKPCAVQFAHPTVSACHCMVIAERERLWVADLGSANGTLLDGEAVTAAAWPEHVPLSIGRLNLVPRRRSGAEDAGGEDAAGPAGASEVLPGASSEVSPAVASRKSPPDAPPLDGDDGRASTREPDPADAPPQTRRSERRFRHAAAHPGFPPPHIVLPVVSPQNNPIISDGPERDGAEGDQLRRSGWHGDETLPAAGTQNTLPPAADAIPPPAEAGNDRPPADRSDGAAGLVSPENDFITIAANGAGPGETDVLLVVPPSADAGQWISEQPAGFAMQDDRGAAWVKDLVLSLLAEEAEAEGGSSADPASRISWNETLVASPDLDGCGETPGLLPPDDRAECLARREAELSARETFLHEFAKTLEEMSAELLHFQDSLLAEDDRIQEEKKRLEEVRARLGEDREALCREQDAAMAELRRVREVIHLEQRKLAEAREEVEAASQALAQGEQSLHEREEAMTSREEAVQVREQALLAESQRLAEQAESLRRREARLAAEQQALQAREAALEAEHETWRRRIEEWERRAEAERKKWTEQANLQEEIDRLQTECTRLSGELAAGNAESLRQRAEWQAETSRLQAELARLETESARLQAELGRAADERQRLSEDARRRDDERRRWEQDRQAWEEQRAALSAETERLRTELRQYERDREDWRQRQAEWERQRAAWDAERASWDAERASWESRSAEREAESRAWEVKYAELQARLAERQAAPSSACEPAPAVRSQPASDRPQIPEATPDRPETLEPTPDRPETPQSAANRGGATQAGEERSAIPRPGKVEPQGDSAQGPPDFRRFISKQTGPGPLVIPRLPPRRRGSAPRWLAAAAVLAAVAAAVTWYRLPRPAVTTATLDFSQSPKLMHARDGTLPHGLEAADLPFAEPFLPDDEEVVGELLAGEGIRDNAVVASLAEPRRELPDLLFISRSEDVPFMHLRLRATEPREAESLLQRWGEVYAGALRRRTEAAGRAALERVEAERQDVAEQIARLTAQRKEIEGRLGTARPVELEVRRLQAVHMAEVGEQELGQLARQITELARRRDAAAATAAQPSPPVDPAELNAALETDAEVLEIRARLAALESPQAAGPEAAPAASVQEQIAELRGRWEALRAKHQERLARQKKEAAQLTVETLAEELRMLEARRAEAAAEVAAQRQIAADCAAAAETLRRTEQELPELESRAVRLATKAEQLQAALADAAGKGPAISTQSQNLHEPAEFFRPLLAAVAAALSVFAVWGVSALLIARRHPVRYFIEEDAASEPPLPRSGKSGLKAPA